MASIEKRVRNGRKTWRAHYRTPAGAQRNKTFPARSMPSGSWPASRTPRSSAPTSTRRSRGSRSASGRSDGSTGQAHLKPTTASRYAGILRKHIHPKWDRVKLANVSHGDVQAWVTELAGATPLPPSRRSTGC